MSKEFYILVSAIKDKVFRFTLKMLTVNTDIHKSFNINKELSDVIPKNIYKELMVIKEEDNTITFLIRQEGNRIKEFIMTIDGVSPLLIYLEGDMDINQLSQLSESMDIDGMENIEKIEE